MIPVLLATTLTISPYDLVRVDDPHYPGADAVSATGAVLLHPPAPGVHWRWEAVPQVDDAPATEALTALDVPAWHAMGARGQGVKVAVFDLQWFGSQIDPSVLGPVTTQDCYSTPTCNLPMDTLRPRFSFEEGVHGYACAQIVHDIAPDAELHLVRVNGETTLDNATDWAIREGIDVVSMSLSFFNTSFYDGTGTISAEIDKLAAAGVLMVVSAGNYAQAHWSGQFTEAGDGRMLFDGQPGLWVHLPAGSASGVYVNWNQHRACGQTDLDAYLYDPDGYIVARGEDPQVAGADHCQPVERLQGTIPQDGWYWLEVVWRRGSTVDLDVDVLATNGTLRSPRPEGSVPDPASSPNAFTVGAVRASGYLLNDVESFSSWGPTHAGVAKPDIAGPDGVTTTAYGARGFYGTSAAAPAVAGAVALVMSDDPTLTPLQAARRLQGWATAGDPQGPWRPDPRWGAGRARLPDPNAVPGGCGRGPLLLPLFFPPLAFLRRRRRA